MEEKTGESSGEARSRAGGRRRGGVAGAGTQSKAGNDLRWTATLRGFSQRSRVESVVGCAGQSKMFGTVCSERSQLGHMSLSDLPILS